jgi:hypothetical protein
VIGTVATLLRGVVAPATDGLFHVCALPGNKAYYVGRDSQASPAILIAAAGPGRTVPLRLAGIEARFGILCNVAEEGRPERTETLTAIICMSHEAGIEAYFASAAETLVAVLGQAPTTLQVEDAVEHLVDLFQKLRKPAARSLVALVGELGVIWAARDVGSAVSAWRGDPDERFDFVIGKLRVDAKAATDHRRVHSVSMEQANPPPGTIGLLASIWIDAAGGGTSVREHLIAIEARLGHDYPAIMRLRTIVADTLGETLIIAMEWRFDLAAATSSLTLYDMRAIPAVRPPLPSGVTGIRFISDISNAPVVDVATVARELSPAETGLLPPLAC